MGAMVLVINRGIGAKILAVYDLEVGDCSPRSRDPSPAHHALAADI